MFTNETTARGMLERTANRLFNTVDRWTASATRSATRRRTHDAPVASAGVEALESRAMLTIIGVAGAWNGGVFDQVGIFDDTTGNWQLDNDGDGFVDGPAFRFGRAGDTPIAGDWDGDGFASVGFHRGRAFVLDTNENRRRDASDVSVGFGNVGDIPVVGNWTNNEFGADRIGVFRRGAWFLDVNGDARFTSVDISTRFGLTTDTPVTGNWNIGTGDSIGVFRDGVWSIDRTENFVWNGRAGGDFAFTFGSASDQPFTADFLGDNTDDVAIFQTPPAGNPQFFARELRTFPGWNTLAVAAVSSQEEPAVVTPGDEDRRDELFADSDRFIEI